MTNEGRITKLELLYACIDTWLPLNDEEQAEFERLLSELPEAEQTAIREMIVECEAARPRWTKYLFGDHEGEATPDCQPS